MTPNTHLEINAGLVGSPAALEPGKATVILVATPAMAADDRGLVHGGFTFGLADYAAMLAVNDPNVVLGAASCRFLGPAVVGATMRATATVEGEKGKKRTVRTAVHVDGRAIFEGEMTCFVLDQHVLDT